MMTHIKGGTSACLSPIAAPLLQQSASNIPLKNDMPGDRPLYLPDETMHRKGQDELEAVRQDLISEHMPIVRSIARRIHEQLPAHVSADDLYGAGVIGLLESVDRFDPSKGSYSAPMRNIVFGEPSWTVCDRSTGVRGICEARDGLLNG